MTGKIPPAVLRLLDANLNRAREGVRVVEDTARFVWDEKQTYRRLRSIRHALHDITATAYKSLVLARETESDAGRVIKEPSKRAMTGLVSANLRRAQEAVRVLEEYSKVFSPNAASELKAIRFRLYREEKDIVDSHG
jgi:thiamine-phosphate pyrophosphorylase